jgi:hypothetical protein
MTLQSLLQAISYDIMSARTSNISQDVTIRSATAADLEALERVAGLDSKRLPAGPLVVAVVEGRIWAAVSTVDDSAIADPFVPSGDLVGLLRTRASQLRDSRTRAPVPRLEPLLARLR